MQLADSSIRLKTLQVMAPYRGINKLPAQPVVMIIRNTEYKVKRASSYAWPFYTYFIMNICFAVFPSSFSCIAIVAPTFNSEMAAEDV